jgi:ATP synthase subunit 6
VVFLVLLLFFLLVRATLSVDKPGPPQHIAEMLHGFVSDQAESIIGHGFERYVPFVTTIFVFVLISNLLGLLPGFISPTAKPWVPLGVATLTFLYYHYQGIRANGPGYVKQFIGPIWWISWLMLPIEIISHIARILSLTVRLYANMRYGDAGLLLARSAGAAYGISGAAPFRVGHSGFCLHAAGDDLSGAGDGARALGFSGRCESRGRNDISGREPLPPSLHRP